MQFKMDVKTIDWWFWAVTLFLIITALAGWRPGYYLVMAISAVQVVYFTWTKRSLVAFPTQVRIFYFLITLFGLIQLLRVPFFIVLLIGTFMVTFFDRCTLARILLYMPWNRDVQLG